MLHKLQSFIYPRVSGSVVKTFEHAFQQIELADLDINPPERKRDIDGDLQWAIRPNKFLLMIKAPPTKNVARRPIILGLDTEKFEQSFK